MVARRPVRTAAWATAGVGGRQSDSGCMLQRSRDDLLLSDVGCERRSHRRPPAVPEMKRMLCFNLEGRNFIRMYYYEMSVR